MYFNHDRIWNDRAFPRVPKPVRRLLRRGDGPLRVLAVAAELWGLAQVVMGALVVAGYASTSAIPPFALATSLIWLAVALVVDLSDRDSPEQQFDRDLSSLIEEFNAVLHEGSETRPEGEAREELKRRATDVATRLKALPAPDDEWRDVRDDYVELLDIHLTHFGEVLPEEAQYAFAGFSQRATARCDELRRRYRAEQ
jgi:hypothetical protein